jgi:glycine/D-amino acid oxidase-like deaminating enzyme
MALEVVSTVIIGGGQAGLAAGYYLHEARRPFVILDEHPRVGDMWRNRWDSLRLFTPGRYDSLPGVHFPGPRSAYPGKDAVADYFEAYADSSVFPSELVSRSTGCHGLAIDSWLPPAATPGPQPTSSSRPVLFTIPVCRHSRAS